ncbi:MAG: pitrilysin family protein, partial [Planctomycetota bacterium]
MKKTAILVSLLFAVALLALSCAAGDRAGTQEKSVLVIPAGKGQRPQRIKVFADEEKGIYMRTLPNGLRVVIRENHTAPVVYCNVAVHTGSIHEGEYLGYGMSHILEHVVAGGTTTTRSEDEIGKLEERIGAYANAATSKDYTEYYMTVASRYFETAVDILSDQIIRCTFDRKEFEREFGVVTQEVLKGREEPGRLMWMLFDEAAYDRHPGRLPVIGYLERFLRLNREDIIRYYRERYVPENMVLAIAGDVDHEEAFRVVAKAFEPMEEKPLAKVEFPEEPVKRGKRYVERETSIGKAMMRMGFRTVKAKERDMYPLDLLAYIAGRGRSSALYRVLCEEKGLVQDVFAYSNTPDYVHGHFVIGCDLEPGKIEDVQKEIIAVMERFKKPLPKETLELAAKKMVADYVLENQDMASQGELLAQIVMHSGDPLDIERYIERIRKVKPADIVRVVGEYFSEDNLTVAVLKPRTSPEGKQNLPLLEAKQKKSGIVKFKLDNGLTVLLKRNPSLPVVAM